MTSLKFQFQYRARPYLVDCEREKSLDDDNLHGNGIQTR
jgi:hypothetical protein